MISLSLLLLALSMIFVITYSHSPKSLKFTIFDMIAIPASNVLLAVVIYELVVQEHKVVLEISMSSSESPHSSNNLSLDSESSAEQEQYDSTHLLAILRQSDNFNSCDEAIFRLYYTEASDHMNEESEDLNLLMNSQ